MGQVGERVRRLATGRWFLLAMLFALLIVLDYRYLGLSRLADQRGGDVLLKLNTSRRPQSDRVVIIDIDQRSLEMMNDLAGSWPWPRSVHGELIDWVMQQQPRGMAFDILFNEADIYRPEHDAAFADAVARHPNVWLAMTLNADGQGAWVSQMPPAVGAQPARKPPVDARVPLMMPLVVAPEAMRGGLINFTSDSDGVGRHHSLYREQSGWRFPSLAARMLRDLGRPLPPDREVLLNWRSGWKHVSFADVYLDALREHPQRPRDEFKGKLVVVGTAAPGLLDLRLTPLSSTYPGVQILATGLDNLDRGDWLREVPRSSVMPFALALIALVAIGLARNVSANRIGYALLAITVAAIAVGALALANGVFVPAFGPLAFGWTFYFLGSGIAYFEERNQRLRTSGMFKRFLDPRVVTSLIETGEIDHRNSAESREVSVLFSDIRGFTSLSEVSSAEDVVALLNGYFSQQVKVIFRHSGTLDKFIGDAIMAFWGAPVASADHAEQAVAAALDMSAALEALRGQLGALGAELEIGIGIHSGRAVVGFIGSNDRLDYTVIGDTVNLASRIEGLTKGIARVLVSEATREAAGDAFEWRDCGSHKVKGREAPVRLFEPTRRT
ncbi:CHASE2 domain-containing protein [Novosphingobium sp. JCM 18896]|uniref:CHASE2 domain-containing protein n=1 Tax=Novosphingobium sp. JCM 18896 TaxID=2989731 RepID=UPI0022239D3F|nr:CHASE2 domain-containing protein [Novosphingobium sp. JCM 18896]MCW1429464.1 CHASE2 domain-containing protein [Novosphingobium sp. JCM 18896]